VILVHLPTTWPQVLAGQMSAADATLGEWYGLSDDNLAEYGDALAGVFEHEVVSAYDVTGWQRNSDRRVIFSGTPSKKWAHLIGTPNPGKPWGVRGKARPVQYLDTRIIAATTAPIENVGDIRRATLGGFTLAVDHAGSAVLTVPAGHQVTVRAEAA
jgi:hypothetical protein